MPLKKQIKNIQSNHERCIVLLLGGSIYDESMGAVRIVKHGRRRDDETRRTMKDVIKDSFLWERDFRALVSSFERIGVTVWRSLPTTMNCSKVDTIKSITDFFVFDDFERKENAMNYGPPVTFIIYWCGHGEPDAGNWFFSDGEMITCTELINIWTSANRDENDALTIISDSCYSGAWIDELREKQIPNLAYQAACRSNETAWVVDDRNVPRSLLMRRFFLEVMQDIESNDDIMYTWTCTSQHPIHFCNYAQEDEIERRTVVRGGFSFFTIDEHTKMKKNPYTSEPNGNVRHGKFLKIVKK